MRFVKQTMTALLGTSIASLGSVSFTQEPDFSKVEFAICFAGKTNNSQRTKKGHRYRNQVKRSGNN